MEHLPSLGFVGAGKVGSTLARLWHNRGYTVRAIYSLIESDAQALAALVGAEVVSSPARVIEQSDLTLLTVPDDAIEPLAKTLHGNFAKKAIIHTSGAHDIRSLAALEGQGAITGSLHPAFPFADVETAINTLPDAAFAVEAVSERLQIWLRDMVTALNGRLMLIPPGGKALYHAALVFASNYTVTLYALGERLLTGLGIERAAADQALNMLVTATVENVRTRGIPDALTGPLTRQDTGTVAVHLDALAREGEQYTEVYQMLARLTYPLLAERNIPYEAIEALFKSSG